MSTRDDILAFLRDPASFARTATDPDLWIKGLEEFAIPSIAREGDRPLRDAQVAAWRGLATERAGLILGPPGTGKTHLLSWLVAGQGAVRRAAAKPSRTLVCAFTKNAVGNVLDAVAKRQAAHDASAPPPIYYGAAPGAGLSPGVSLVGRGDEQDVAAAIASNHAVVGATIWSLYRLIKANILPGADGPTAPIFDLVCIDEASQMVLGQGLMALAGMAPGCRIVVSGDDQQLPPVRSMRSIEVEGRELGGSLYAFMKSANAAEFPLVETFRLNEPLARFPERQFYPGRYVSATPDDRLALRTGWEDGLDPLSKLVFDPALPIVVLVHDGPAAATSNPFEAALAARFAIELAERIGDGTPPLAPSEFWSEIAAVVSPHRAQNAAIRSLLPAPWKADAFVETVDRIQGKERDAVILSYCVADPEFALAEADFIFSPERLNVASTRARTKLILLISRRLLEAAPAEQEMMDKAELLREFVYACDLVGETNIEGPSGRQISTQIRALSFAGEQLDVRLEEAAGVDAEVVATLTAELEGLLGAIRRAAAASQYGSARLSDVRKAMALPAEPLADARLLHHLGWISLQQRRSQYGTFWIARPFDAPRRVYAVDLETVRERIAFVVREERSGAHCFYDNARDRFAWMTDKGQDLLLGAVQQLQDDGVLTLGSAGGHMTIAIVAATVAPDGGDAEPEPPLPILSDPDFTLLNGLEDLEAARVNFGIFDGWTSTTELARTVARTLADTLAALSRLEAHGHVMLAEDARVRTRVAELAREVRHVKQRFRADDAAQRPYLVRNLKLELRDRIKPVRDHNLADVFAEAIEASMPAQAEALEGLRRSLVSEWGDQASLAGFQRRGLLDGLAAWRGDGPPTLAIAADTGSGKTEAAALPIIVGALGDALEGIKGTRAVLAYPRVRLAANQAQRLAAYLAAAASVPQLPLLTLGLQVKDVPDDFEAMGHYYVDQWREAGPGRFEFPFFACPSCGQALLLLAGRGRDGADALVCTGGDWRFDGWIGSKRQLRERPPSLFLPTVDSLHQWMHDPRYGSLFGDVAGFAPPRALLADEIHLYTHVHGAQVGMTLRRLAARAALNSGDARPMVAIGMSATISDPGEAWGRLMGRSEVITVRPDREDMRPNPRGREIFYFVQPEVESRGADIAGASTTIQTLMCLAHGMRRRTGAEGGYRSLVFFDSIDKMRRLHGAYTDAEEGKGLAALRTSHFGDDSQGSPQTDCCRDPVGCDRFVDGECWWFAANDARQIGAGGRRAAGDPLRVARTPIYSGTSSEAEALVKGSDIVFATSSLEVGYDDPDMTLVYQHYAPQNLASFIQRKGRGGRGVDDRPTTAVTLSIYSPRDRWWFRRPADMISPAAFRIPINPNNYFVRRGQVLASLLDGLARLDAQSRGFDFSSGPSDAMLAEAGQLTEEIFGSGVWAEFKAGSAAGFWHLARAAQRLEAPRYFRDLRHGLRWAPDLLFETINLPALAVIGPDVVGGEKEDIALALTTVVPGNATRRYNGSKVHWRPPSQGAAPWLSDEDYRHAERQRLAADSGALLSELPLAVRPALADVEPDLCRPTQVTLERVGWMAGAHWTGEVGYAVDRNPPLGALSDDAIPLRHDSNASLQGFLIVEAKAELGAPVSGSRPIPSIRDIAAHIGNEAEGKASGLVAARVYWGADGEMRFDSLGADAVNFSQSFVDPASGRPLLHGYKVETEGLRFAVDETKLSAFTAQMLAELADDPGRARWHRSQFLRYLVESRGRALGAPGYDVRLAADIFAAAASHPEFESALQRLGRFWSSEAVLKLFEDVRSRLLSQHPLLTERRVQRAAAAVAGDAFQGLFKDAAAEVQDAEAMRAYLASAIVHGLTLRLKLLVSQVGQGNERNLLAHAKLPLQFGADAGSTISICEGGAFGDGTIRGVVDHWDPLLDLVADNFLGACPNADEDAALRRFWEMRDRHDAWRGFDPRDAEALAEIAAALEVPLGEPLAPAVVRILFGQEAIEAEAFALYDLALDVEKVRSAAFGDDSSPVVGWELASAAVVAAQSGAAAILAGLLAAYAAVETVGEGSLTPEARLAEQVFRLSAPLCADGCRSCVHQSSDLMGDSLAEASVSRSLLQRFLTTAA